MKSIFISTVLILMSFSSVKANEMQENWDGKWQIYVLAGSPNASESEVSAEINDHFPIYATNATNSNLINLEFGAGLTYMYSVDWSTSLSVAGAGDFSTHNLCFILCDLNNSTHSSLKSITHYYLTQNYSIPLWKNGFAVLKAGASLTSYKLNQKIYSNEIGEYENSYSSTERQWGAVAGVKVTHIFADTFSIALGHDQFTFLDSSISYLEFGYVF